LIVVVVAVVVVVMVVVVVVVGVVLVVVAPTQQRKNPFHNSGQSQGAERRRDHKHSNHDTVYGVIKGRLGFHKVCTRWVCKQVTGECNHTRLTMFLVRNTSSNKVTSCGTNCHWGTDADPILLSRNQQPDH
jgi:hypothetical protein